MVKQISLLDLSLCSLELLTTLHWRNNPTINIGCSMRECCVCNEIKAIWSIHKQLLVNWICYRCIMPTTRCIKINRYNCPFKFVTRKIVQRCTSSETKNTIWSKNNDITDKMLRQSAIIGCIFNIHIIRGFSHKIETIN
jgi:hypothetical protein